MKPPASMRRIVAFCCSLALSAWLPAIALALVPDDPGPGDVTFSVNSGQNVRAISPYIYGTNFNSVPNATFNRSGGNRMTGHNWENNASNAGGDWYHHSDFGLASGPYDPPGSAVRGMIQSAAANGQAALITVPMAGYVAADGDGTVDETEIAPSPRWKEVVPKKSTIYPGSSLSTNPDKTDGYVFTDEFVNWAEDFKDPNQPLFYSLDNEPALWGETLQPDWQSGEEPRPWENPPYPGVAPSAGGRTHPTIHPYEPTYAELREKTIAHAGAIKDVNPNAMVFGGVGYGWGAFENLQGAPDAATYPSHGGGDETGEMHYYEWLLKEVATAEAAQGRELMDVIDLHWYTEVYADGQRITGDVATPDAVAARVQATRSLWDPTYTEDSWIAQWKTYGPIKLLPRVQRDIDDFNPGTKIAITEYNYGGTNHISGAIAQADALGIFGREGVFAASMWGGGSYINAAFNMYLDYDGAGGTFGDVSVDAETDDIAASAIYASLDSEDPNRMVLVAINRTDSAQDAALQLTYDRAFDHVEVYRIESGSSTPTRYADIELDDLNALIYSMPAWSVTTLVLVADGLPGDYNRDGVVDAADYTVWRDAVGQTGNVAADGNEDNVVDTADYLLWRENYGHTETASGTAGLATVPEPTAIVLMGMAGLAVVVRRFRRRR